MEKLTDRVERTVFLDKAMVQQIIVWFLMILFDEDNEDFEQKLRSAVLHNREMAAEMLLTMFTMETVNRLYEVYTKAESAEGEENATD